MLQRGTVVEHRASGCKGVIIGTTNGIDCIQMVNGERLPFIDGKGFKIINDEGNSHLLDTEKSLKTIKFETLRNEMTQVLLKDVGFNVSKMQSEIDQLKNELAKEKEKLSCSEFQTHLTKVSVDAVAKELTNCRNELAVSQNSLANCQKDLDKAEAHACPEVTFRIGIGTKQHVPLSACLPISLGQANVIAENLSRSVRRQVVVEHVKNGQVEYASRWKSGVQVS